MGNKYSRSSVANSSSVDGVYKHRPLEYLHKESQTFANNQSNHSLSSYSSRQSDNSTKSWSKVSRRRLKDTTQLVPYEGSKSFWPVSQLEAFFLPEFPIEGYSESDFELIEEISKGTFGRVYKVKKLASDDIVALKVLSKFKILQENSIQQVKHEVQIQKLCGHHPFIVNCLLNWQSRKKLFIVSEFVAGGELYNVLVSYRILPHQLVQLYVAQIASAIDFLHNAGVIHRDLKPENILLDEDGNIQLIDFGLAKWLSYGNRTQTICGTVQYMAPEILSMQPYGHAADWWSLGVIACLMLTNEFPEIIEENDDGDGVSVKYIKLPEDVALEMPPRDLILRLLELDPGKRLTSLRKLQTIPFYKGYKFDDVQEKKVRPRDLFPESPDAPKAICEVPQFDDEMNLFS